MGFRESFCEAAIQGTDVSQWVIRDVFGRGHVPMHVRSSPKADVDSLPALAT